MLIQVIQLLQQEQRLLQQQEQRLLRQQEQRLLQQEQRLLQQQEAASSAERRLLQQHEPRLPQQLGLELQLLQQKTGFLLPQAIAKEIVAIRVRFRVFIVSPNDDYVNDPPRTRKIFAIVDNPAVPVSNA